MPQFNWQMADVELNGLRYSLVVVPKNKLRLRITGKGNIPCAEKLKEWQAYRDQLSEILIEDGIRSIGKNAFSEFTALESIYLPSSLFRIESGAFAGCPALSKVYFSGTVTQLHRVRIAPDALPAWFYRKGDD